VASRGDVPEPHAIAVTATKHDSARMTRMAISSARLSDLSFATECFSLEASDGLLRPRRFAIATSGVGCKVSGSLYPSSLRDSGYLIAPLPCTAKIAMSSEMRARRAVLAAAAKARREGRAHQLKKFGA